jgi:hypothetical protein
MEDEGKEPEAAVEGAGLLATADDSTEKSDNTEAHCRRKDDEPSTQIDFLAPGPTALPSVHLPPAAALPSEVKLLRHYGYYCDSRKLNRWLILVRMRSRKLKRIHLRSKMGPVQSVRRSQPSPNRTRKCHLRSRLWKPTPLRQICLMCLGLPQQSLFSPSFVYDCPLMRTGP